MADTVDITEFKIIKIGSLYFIPVNKSMRSVDLTDFIDGGPNYGQPKFISTSGHDQFHEADGDHHWVVVEIPALRNGDTRSVDDIIRELNTVNIYLFNKDLVPNPDFPGIIVGDPFSPILQMA